MDEREIRLTIRSTADDHFEVEASAVGSLSGSARETFKAPLVEESLAELRRAVEAEVERRDSEPPAKKAGLPVPLGAGPGLDDAGAIGSRLYEALFHGSVRSFYERCAAAVDSSDSDHRRLRIRLLFDHTDEKIDLLAKIPWELLQDAESGLFLGRDRARPIVRDFTARRWVEPLLADLPLRVLVIDAGDQDLNADVEIREIREALDDPRHFRLIPFRDPEPYAIRRELDRRQIHIAHFICHGGYDEESGIGAVFLRTKGGTKLQVTGNDLAHALLGLPHLRLVVFNSCLTGALAGREGIASARLMLPQPPAIVGMQHGISHRSAIDFSSTFYTALADGQTVDAAASEARLALAFETSEWATPTLFMPSRDGRLFELAKPAGSRSAAVRTPLPGDEPKPGGDHDQDRCYTLAIHSMTLENQINWGGPMQEEADDYLSLTEFFDEREIRDPALWQRQVLPRLRTFLLQWARTRNPLLLDFAAHPSIAFAAGWVLEIKNGIDITIRQRSAGGFFEWSPDDGSAQPAPLWRLEEHRVASDAADVVLALSVANPIAADIASYLETHDDLRISRLIDARIHPEPGQRAVAGGDHCLQLAQRLAAIASRRTPAERQGTLHLFSSAPNALLFYLGQLSRTFGRVQLYEHPRFGKSDSYGHYVPSLVLPPEEEGDAG